MTEPPEFWPGAEICGYQIVVDDAGVILLMLRLRGGATVGWPLGVPMADDLSGDLHEAVTSAVEMGGLCPDCGAKHEYADPPMQLPLDLDAALKRMITEESGDER